MRGYGQGPSRLTARSCLEILEADDWRRDRIGAAERGENPTVFARMQSGLAVLGDSQFLPGYCVLLASPSVQHLSNLDAVARRALLSDLSDIAQMQP